MKAKPLLVSLLQKYCLEATYKLVLQLEFFSPVALVLQAVFILFRLYGPSA